MALYGIVLVWFFVCLAMAHSDQNTAPLELDSKYHKHNNLTKYLHAVVEAYPNLTSLHSIGQSIQKRDLWVLVISAASEDEIGIPNVKLVGTIHGNEPVGRELILHFIQFLVTNYSSNTTVQWLLNNTRIHFLPSMNPDGFEYASKIDCGMEEKGRNNIRGIDLNRNFPDYFRKNTLRYQSETEAVMNWLNNGSFILSGALHGGELVANYPFENSKEDIVNVTVTGGTPQPNPSPDNDVFEHLATIYSSTHPTMHKGIQCHDNGRAFENGIVNGAAWYMLTGGMQDYNYVWHGCMELTLELSCCKYPDDKELPALWQDNKEALLKYVSQAHYGVRGLVLDNQTNETLSRATLKISGRNMTFNCSRRGEFWRLLLPNSYQLEVTAEGYVPEIINFVVLRNEEDVSPKMTWLNVSLVPLSSITSTSTSPTSRVSSRKKIYRFTSITPVEHTIAPQQQPFNSTVNTSTVALNRTMQADENVTMAYALSNSTGTSELKTYLSNTNYMQEVSPSLSASTATVSTLYVLFTNMGLLVACTKL